MINDRRVFPMIADMIKGYTIFKYQQRTMDEDGCLIADLEDFYRAKSLFEAKAESVITHLNADERKIIRYIFTHQGSFGCTYDEIAKGTGISYKTVQRLINGRKDRAESGLIEKYKGLDKIEYNESEYQQETRCNPETGYSSTVNTGSRSRKVTRVKINTEKVNPWEIFDEGFVYLKE
jgi:transposase